jgi:hypothetical protein
MIVGDHIPIIFPEKVQALKTQKLIRVIAAAARPAVGEKKKPVHLP